jgi:hypothetical protein
VCRGGVTNQEGEALKNKMGIVAGAWGVHYCTYCPKNLAGFGQYRGESPMERKFPGNSMKPGIIYPDFSEIYLIGDFLPSTLGNFPS